MNQNPQSKASNLTEGLRRGDLKDMVMGTFTVDQYQSKMGLDKNIIVLRFRAADKEPAIDLMEFIERSYDFVLDSDKSSGEEKDGNYSVFVELERTDEAPKQIKRLLSDISQLCAIKDWRFRWYKDASGHFFDEELFGDIVPLTPEEYESRVRSSDISEIAEFFNQGAIDSVIIDENNVITFNRPYAEPLKAKFIAFGEYNHLKNALNGGIQLDESSRSQVMYLNKYLGNYDINKIEGHFLIRNGTEAVIVAKENW
jgi:hypothetical protein